MRLLGKTAMVLGLAGAMALGSMTASEARGGRNAAAPRVASSLAPRSALRRRMPTRAIITGGYGYDSYAYAPGYAPATTATPMSRPMPRRSTRRRAITARSTDVLTRLLGLRHQLHWAVARAQLKAATRQSDGLSLTRAGASRPFSFLCCASRSSAPCRMKIAACWSITAARFLRLTSAAISSRSTAAVDSRSSHSAIGRSVSLARLRAKARTDCARGPSLPSMLRGRPSTKPTQRRSAASASRRLASSGEGLARDGFDAGGEPAVGVRGGDADGLGADVEAEQRAARRQVRGGLAHFDDDGSHESSIRYSAMRTP